MKVPRQVLVIGDGAIGVAIAGLLAPLGLVSRFIGRSGPVAMDAQISGNSDSISKLQSAPLVNENIQSDIAGVELVIVAVKAFDLASALARTRDLPKSIPVWSFGNGAIYAEITEAAKLRPDLIWRLGYCTFGISVVADRSYAWRSQTGEFAVGAWSDAPSLVGEPLPIELGILRELPKYFKWHQNIDRLHRRKWLFNTVINTLAAARHLPCNGDILADLPMLAAVFTEAWDLGKTLWGDWPMAKDEAYQVLLRLVDTTANNENSMARDVRLGRPTESDYLAGLAKDTRRFPLLTSLHRQLQVQE